MLTKELKILTVTFDGAQSEGYMYPDTDYGETLSVKIEHHHKEDVDKSVTVTIGDKMLLPSDLKYILKIVEMYKEAAKHFAEE